MSRRQNDRNNRRRPRRPIIDNLLADAADTITKSADPNVVARVVSSNDQLAASMEEMARKHAEEE